jgi:hypothetical protein
LAFFSVVVKSVQEDEVQIVVNGLCVLESIGPEIGENAVETLWVLDNLNTNDCFRYLRPQGEL